MSGSIRMMAEEGAATRRAGLSDEQRALLEQRLRSGLRGVSRPQGIPRRPEGSNAPLSFAQQRLWFLDQLDPESPLYNISVAVRIEGSLDAEALRHSIDAIVARHEALRTRFVSVEGNPVQCVDAPRPVELPVMDLTGLRGAEQQTELRARLKQEAGRPFSLARDLMCRALLLKLGTNEHVFSFTAHHIAADGWSLGVFFRELAACYESHIAGRNPLLPALAVQYGDYACWQRETMTGDGYERRVSHWKKLLAGAPDVLELPADRRRPAVETFRGACETLLLPTRLNEDLKALGHREDVTQFMLLLAAFKTLIYRYTRQTDVLVGTPVAGRNQIETENLIGFFINTVVMRTDLSGDPTFRDLLQRLRQGTIDALMHQDLPFERLVDALKIERSLSRNPLFQVMFVLQSAAMQPVGFGGLAVTPVEVPTETAKFDLTMSIEDRPQGLAVTVEYSSDLFNAPTIRRLLGHYQSLLESIVANPAAKISQLRLLPEGEEAEVLKLGIGTQSHYPRNRNVAELFEAEVQRNPNAVAVVFEGKQLTYRQLNARANQLAHFLTRQGVGPDIPVAVCMERSLELIIALVGILKAGGAYFSLDPAYPVERLNWMLEDARPPVLLTREKWRGLFAATRGTQIICADDGWPTLDKELDQNLAPLAKPENVAYVSFTSGSTGRPKGVCVPHRGVVRLVKDTDYATLDREQVFLQFSPVAFDASTLEIWGALLNGARLVVFPPQTPQLSELGAFIQKHGITTLWLTAGLFHQMVDEQLEAFKGVKQLLAGGDVLFVPQVQRVRERWPECRLINGYGPTENTTFTCCHQIAAELADGASIPIGRPIANTTVYVVDQQLKPVPVGIPGELYTGGDGLACGYLNRPELTTERFVADPFNSNPGSRLYRTGDLVRWLPDGNVEFLGRADLQVKVRGFRVEPGEIELALAEHPGVQQCAVVAREDGSTGKRLVGYVVPAGSPSPTVAELRAHLKRTLPDYMLPSVFVFLETMPVSPNGKLDRRQLPAPDQSRSGVESNYAGPKTPQEEQLVAIWEEVLNVRPIGVNDQFFDLGGHSLLAVRLAARIEKVFCKKLPVAVIFQSPTVQEMAKLLAGDPVRNSGTSIVPIQPKGQRPPLFLVHGVGGGMFWGYTNLAKHLGQGQPIYAFKSRGMDGLEELPTVEEMAAAYVADLRAFQPVGPYYVGGYCFGGNVAYEMARQLTAQGERVAMLALMNCAPPNSSYNETSWKPAFLWKFARNLGHWVADFFSWDKAKKREFIRWQMRTLPGKFSRIFVRSRSEAPAIQVTDIVDLAAYSESQQQLWTAHIRALFAYHPQSYSGKVTLLRSRTHPLLCSFDPTCGWGGLAADGVEIRLVSGAHESILEEPHVNSVARELDHSLAAVQKVQEELQKS